MQWQVHRKAHCKVSVNMRLEVTTISIDTLASANFPD